MTEQNTYKDSVARNLKIGKKALLHTNHWFHAPDGKQYNNVFGTIKAVLSDEETLGIKTNRGSTDWYVEIGNMTIAGCQILYGIATDTCNLGEYEDYHTSAEHGCKKYISPSRIYNADVE